jgi:hypothetical protein
MVRMIRPDRGRVREIRIFTVTSRSTDYGPCPLTDFGVISTTAKFTGSFRGSVAASTRLHPANAIVPVTHVSVLVAYWPRGVVTALTFIVLVPTTPQVFPQPIIAGYKKFRLVLEKI